MPISAVSEQHRSDALGLPALRERPPPLALSSPASRPASARSRKKGPAAPSIDGSLSARTSASASATRSRKAFSESMLGPLNLPPMPKCFRCTLCSEVMTDPTTAADGFNYHRKCIEGWLQSGQSTSPETKEPLQSHALRANDVLKDAMEQYVSLADLVTQEHRRWRGYAVTAEDRLSRKLAQKDAQVRELKAVLSTIKARHSHSSNGSSTSPEGSSGTAPLSARSLSSTTTSSDGGLTEDSNPHPCEFVATLSALPELPASMPWGSGSAPRNAGNQQQQQRHPSATVQRSRRFRPGWWHRGASATSGRSSV